LIKMPKSTNAQEPASEQDATVRTNLKAIDCKLRMLERDHYVLLRSWYNQNTGLYSINIIDHDDATTVVGRVTSSDPVSVLNIIISNIAELYPIEKKLCEYNITPERVFDTNTKTIISCKEYKKKYGDCPVFRRKYERSCQE